ncbi:MAG: AraC family transcriptional regulator [Verrucomicrobia bacterium]|nr:AraC family transcriptional regulator [Verrucomicrobiota bacterium]MBU4428983.1 AraC family transcriptional regulator [Verrucomicrobiota bacterium]MBU4497182.1 AraC family transcriptional regulator [Verrucomicrobiota bacterium]MCG2680454.1 AraC family transcriptional regulator [Kiritimatiellia bacterium]
MIVNRSSTKSETETVPAVARPSAIRPVFARMAIAEMTKPGVVSRHQHLGYEVIFVDQGLYRCRHNETDLTLGRNELLIVKPGDWHTDIFNGKYLRYLGLGFNLHVVSGMPVSIFRDNTPVARQHFIVNRADFLPLIEKIGQEARIGDFVAVHIQDAIVLEFFYRMVRVIPSDILSDCFVATSREASFLARIYSVINERLTRKLRVDELASALGVSESSLAHKCQAMLHCSPARLFQQVKMDRAMQMLKSTDMLVKEVGAYLGFDNPFQFSRAFKKAFGKSPSAVKEKPQPAV